MNKKIVLYISIIVLSCLSLFFYLNKNKNLVNDKVVINKNGLIAIMVETSSGNYEQVDDNQFNREGYSFNKEKSYCRDINGNIVDEANMSFENGNIIVSTSKNVTCVAYFDKIPEYTVNLTVINGTSNVSSITLYSGEDAEFIITPNDDIELSIDNDNCSGEVVLSENKYIIKNVTEDKNCTITIKKSGINLYEMIKEKADKTTVIDMDKASGYPGFETNGIYTTTLTDSGLPVYYYRGNVNNYLIFAGFKWRIIRTTDTGGIKLLYSGLKNSNNTFYNYIEINMYNENINDNAYVGYMYGTPGSTSYAKTHENLHDSDIKKTVDKWFENNLLSYINQIEDTVYCNDRNPVPGSTSYNNYLYNQVGTMGYGTNKTGYGSLSKAHNYTVKMRPTLVCKNTQGSVPENNDSFTVSSEIGNGKLTYPIGLITTDEIAFAGVTRRYLDDNTYGNNSYIISSQAFWTMSPAQFDSYANVNYFAYQYSDYNVSVYSRTSIRPVISLKNDTMILTTGDGTISNPYVVIEK